MSVVVYSPTYTDQVYLVLAVEFPGNAIVDPRNNKEYRVLSLYHSLVKYVGRHVSARVPRQQVAHWSSTTKPHPSACVHEYGSLIDQ